jgi:hypothetical protein
MLDQFETMRVAKRPGYYGERRENCLFRAN